MDPQHSSVNPQPEKKAAPATPTFTGQQWEAAATALLRTQIDRMDAVAASTTTAATEDKFVMIDGRLYVKSWLVREKWESPEAGMRPRS